MYLLSSLSQQPYTRPHSSKGAQEEQREKPNIQADLSLSLLSLPPSRDMLKRHVISTHSDDLPSKESTSSTSRRKKSAPSSSPEDGEEEEEQRPESSQTRGVFSGSQVDSSWQNESSLSEYFKTIS